MKSNLAARSEAEAIGIQTTSSSRSWTVPLRVLAMLLTILMVATPHPFGRGEAILINYVNNSADAEAFTYYNGWVMIYPFAIAYWAHWLPVTAQVLLYVLLTLFVCLLLQRELHKFLLVWWPDPAATIFSLSVLAVLAHHILWLGRLEW